MSGLLNVLSMEVWLAHWMMILGGVAFVIAVAVAYLVLHRRH